MEIVIAIVAGVLLAVVFVVISAPLRAARRAAVAEQQLGGGEAHRPVPADGYERAELEAARETKYREIRDAELDLRTGKLSREDYDAIDSGLRAEALEILDRLEALDDDRASGRVERDKARTQPDKANPEVEG